MARIIVDPLRLFGAPHVDGTAIPTKDVANDYWFGTVTPGLSNAEVVLACWYEARHGMNRHRRLAWAQWASDTEDAWTAGVPPLLPPGAQP